MENVSRIDLNLLVVLEAIYTEGGVSRAGEKLNLTQPAISHALSRLRELFDDPLFIRDGRGLAPTPLTRGLIEPLRRSLRSLTVVLTEAGRFDPGRTQAQFTIAMRDPVEILALPPITRRIAASAPNVDLRIVEVRRRSIETALASGTLDLALDVPLPLSSSVRRQRIAADPLVVVARQGHPQVGPGMPLATYLSQQHVLVTSRRRGPGLEDLALSQQGLQRRIRLRCRNYAAAFGVVSRTDLLVTVPDRYAGLLNLGFDNQILPLPFTAPTIDAYLYWHEAVEDDPANTWLRELVSRAFADEA
jgi:DNA-binding transcriptional LysR family regulator